MYDVLEDVDHDRCIPHDAQITIYQQINEQIMQILCSPFSEVLRKNSSHISQQLCKRYMRIYVGQLHCIEELRYGRR